MKSTMEKIIAANTRHEALLLAATRSIRRPYAIVAAVLRLHEPVAVLSPMGGYVECHGCDMGDYAEGAPEWPCTTVLKINEFLHVEGIEA